jgi:hypothetical protein
MGGMKNHNSNTKRLPALYKIDSKKHGFNISSFDESIIATKLLTF